jgi:hypothetical protein
VPLIGVQNEGRIWCPPREQFAPLFWDQGVRRTLINANRCRYILWQEAPCIGKGEILVDHAAGIGCALSHDLGEPSPLLLDSFDFITRLSAQRGAEEYSTSVLRDAAKARGNAPEHSRRSTCKTCEGPIELIQLLEKVGIIERRTTGNHCAARDPVPEFIRGGQSVLPAF